MTSTEPTHPVTRGPSGASIGLIGAGSMGGAMARRLLDRGRSLHIYARRPQTSEPLAAAGAHVVASATDLARVSDVVLIVVRTEDQVNEVVLDSGLLAAMRPGSGLILHSTVRPSVHIAVAERARDYAIDVLDAPVSGGPAGAEAGRLSVMVGAEAEVFERHRWVLDELGALVQHFGPVGAGSAMKLINNSLYVVHLRAAFAAMDLAQRYRISLPDAAAALAAGSGDSYAVRRIAGSEFSMRLAGMPSAEHVIDLLAKDVRLLREDATEGDLVALAGESIHRLSEHT
jgi:3-hydroxyisobutyrate dehydrogenase-like beta-hydroxyacid dehydrogenase